MYARSDREQALIAKIRDLADDRVAEVEDFVDFLRSRDEHRQLVPAANGPSERAVSAVQDAPDDAHHTPVERSHQRIKLPFRRPTNVVEMREIYRHLVKPIEHEHDGEYVMVRPDGQMTFAQTLDELTEAANQMRIEGTCFFKVGAISAITIS